MNLNMSRKKFSIYILILIFKLALEYSYWTYLSLDTLTYRLQPSAGKYAYGILWITFLFLLIDSDSHQVSSFFLIFKLVFEMVPITVIFSLANESAIYYSVICVAFAICEIIVLKGTAISTKWSIEKIDKILICGMLMVMVLFLIYVLMKNGLPSFLALNIYRVYELRGENSFEIGKYAGYILPWICCVFVPVLISKYMCEKRIFLAILVCSYAIIMYLYTGMKSYLFALPMVIGVVVWSRRKNFFYEFWQSFLLIFSIICFGINKNSVSYTLFDLFGRRVMLVSANNKYAYYDFFSRNSKMGIAGIFPTWLIPVKNQYEEGIGYIISRIYYKKPEMNSNTGFLAEGYMRFGFVGILAELIILAFILKLMDGAQQKESYTFVLGCCTFLVFQLSDMHLIDSMFFGAWMIMFLFLVFCGKKAVRAKECKR